MSVPSISVINFSPVNDQDAQEAIRAVNRQVTEDFASVWGSAHTLRLHAPSFDPAHPDSLAEESIRGEGVIYLVDEATLPGALGYHDLNTRAVPVGFVFVTDPNDWTVTLSHEVLELIMDPTVNIFVPGPDPRNPSNIVLHTYEVCDAVERSSYEIDRVRVSNFLTKSYFTIGEETGTRNDFLGVGVLSFGVTPDSHIAFFDLSAGTFVTVFGHQESKTPAMSASEIPAMSRRAKRYDHPKPGRPDEKNLQQALDNYHSNPHPRYKGIPHGGLPNMRGITRTGRYKAASEPLSALARSPA